MGHHPKEIRKSLFRQINFVIITFSVCLSESYTSNNTLFENIDWKQIHTHVLFNYITDKRNIKHLKQTDNYTVDIN